MARNAQPCHTAGRLYYYSSYQFLKYFRQDGIDTLQNIAQVLSVTSETVDISRKAARLFAGKVTTG